ncbi:type II secretion system protein [Campylobacter hyointestinalis]|uniref:Prepilin-type N-terminal cleavage/methylation domain-containing protein n=1 Tax=Campylobacter hyointestinalis subsp. lawsonii TaxID=91353 RepID=A0AAV6EE66_CAMHY|nr:prepilin-type N-terminal cleavage/methylation domain-containing protein [Campylobacter hyointestinalis]KAB0612880.1 prepilin-type N-terminal cleavage/methylation domain-containing protein [Campylobacter hyointestinalis subsp. lawsonii]QKF69501.1 type II secretion/transformation system, G protein [Campylobacter hyointestinalis subsp. lawsonii]RAZ26633.1 prepilin-type cleavage/methylation domain-containing protein [Campylobacter hyointestinalis subsp. lawsonii]RAZ29123.1 prepilin-type cleavage
MKKAFTLIELVFVIVILGVLASLAVPKIVGSSSDAEIVKAKTQIATIRTKIQLYANEKKLSGSQEYPNLEEEGKEGLFSAILDNPIKAKTDQKYGWSKNGDKYTFSTPNKSVTFTYDKENGKFECNIDDDLCRLLDK